MSNLTITIDDATVRQARIRAIQEGTSVSAKVREFLALYARGEAGQETASASPLVKLPTFKGTGGMRPGIDPTSNRSVEAAMETDEELIARYNPSTSKRRSA